MKTRRLLSLLLALCMALSCLSVGAMADDDEPEEPEEPEWGTAAWCERNGHDWNDEGQCASCGAECPHEEYWGDGHCRNCDYYDESKDVPVTGAALAVGKNTIALPANLAWSRHAFTPAADAGGVYVFSFLCNEYTDVKLYDDDGSLIASGLGWGDAAFGVELTAEKGYTFQVKLGSEKENVSIVVSVQKCTPGAALSVDSINSLATAADGSWALHPFTPEETGYYRFRSQGVFDPQAMKIGFGWSGDNDVDGIYFGNLNFNFRTEEELSAGTTFYLLIRNLDEKAENIPVIVTPVADPYDEAVPSWHYDEDIREPVFDDGYFTYYDFPVYGTPAWCEAREHSWNSETGKCDICGTVCTHEKWWDDGTCRTCRYFDKEHEASPKDGAALHLGKNDLTLPGSRNSINHAFTPAEIGFYRFTSAVAAGGGDDVDPRACLIDGEGEIITSGDDVSPESSEFCFSTMLAAGKTYTIRLENMEKTEAARSVAVTVEKLDPNGALALGDNETVIGGYYTFTPSDNAIYIFRSTGVYDTKGELWSPGAERMDWNDDDESEGEDNLNFRLSVVLEAGKVYTLYLDGDEDDLGKTCGVRVEKKELTEWEALQQLLEGEEQTVTLMKDYVATADDECLLIPEYRTVTLNLNGHTIDGTALKDEDDEDDEDVLVVKGTLTLTDSTGGSITGSNGDDVVYVNGGRFTMNGGTITASDVLYGAVYVGSDDDCFTMNGGTITVSRTDPDAAEIGAVYGCGSVVINGGTFPNGDFANVYMIDGSLYVAPDASVSVTIAQDYIDGANVCPVGSWTAAQFKKAGLAGKTLRLVGAIGRWSDGKLTVDLGAPAGSLLIVAVYDDHDRQESVRVFPITETGVKTIPTNIAGTKEYSYKLMLVNGETFAPLCESRLLDSPT